MPKTIPFLALEFTVRTAPEWRDLFLTPPPPGGFSYLVTPNVDHIVQLSKRPELGAIYDAADWRMCDSRILEKLGRMRGLDLACYPGADLVRDLIEDPRSRALKIAVVGPDPERFRLLREKFPHHDLHLVEAPFMTPGSAEWEATLAATEAVQADLTLLCISFPKQEIFARDLKTRGHARGQAICAGASIDFLTGQQKRAPEIFRKTSTEWLYRLLSQPGRLWKRYLVDGPRIFAIYLRHRNG
ncbi:WecB/TagA/CpsF family glycosyltransferase [Paenirhodobacter populi]|uniref:WecB/TagA/CpsF family glycosyltransferase n=1 Tax=Paenirhodobacter populi TaxID=2306993 RepID=UPI0013E356A5|nr:WecB/TagA/CpsF family glycosyltransferase [Sinirhodobacter populi]